MTSIFSVSPLRTSFLSLAASCALVACGGGDGEIADANPVQSSASATSGNPAQSAGATSSSPVIPTSSPGGQMQAGTSVGGAPSASTTGSSTPAGGMQGNVTPTSTGTASASAPSTTGSATNPVPSASQTGSSVPSSMPSTSASVPNPPQTGAPGCSNGSAPGFYVSQGKIYDNHCKEFIMRGVNDPYVWYASGAQQRYADIAATGANVVRIVLADGGQWTKVAGSTIKDIISWTKANKLVAVLEVHDATGYGDGGKAQNPSATLDYWTSSDVKSAIAGSEGNVIINIANEAFGNDVADTDWETFYKAAVPKLRSAGIKHMLMVDAPNWGQDWKYLMRDGKGSENIFAADPDKNTVFSVHMYDVYPMKDLVWDYMTGFLEHGVPLVVGEFGADHAGKPIDEAAIMEYAVELGVGYMGWSWGGNSSDLTSLDIVKNFDPKSLSTWGDALINGTNGIKKTSKICSCFE